MVETILILKSLELHPEKEGVEHGDHTQSQDRGKHQPEHDRDSHGFPHRPTTQPQREQTTHRR